MCPLSNEGIHDCGERCCDEVRCRTAPRIGGRPTTIASLATYVPPRLLTNADLEKMVDTSDEWILQRTGIRERHIVDPGVGTSDLGTEAAVKAIANAGLTPADIGLIVVGTVTPDMMFPSTACLVQHKIGAHARVGLRPERRLLGVHLRGDDREPVRGDRRAWSTRSSSAPT